MERTLFGSEPDSSLSSDIAIEVIGRMVAEQTSRLYTLRNEFKAKGLTEQDELVKTNQEYQHCKQQIARFRNEIKAIYRGEHKEEIFNRVEKEYAPYIKQKQATHLLISQ